MNQSLLFSSIALFVTGCLSNRLELAEGNSITLLEVAPDTMKMGSTLYEQQGNLLVIGELERELLDKRPLPGHIDIRALDSAGEEFTTTKAELRSRPARRNGPHPKAFKAELPSLPYGSTVYVEYHEGEH